MRVDRAVLEKWSPLPVGCAMPGTRVADPRRKPRSRVPERRARRDRHRRPECQPRLPRPRRPHRQGLLHRTKARRAYRTGDWGREREGLIFFEGRMDSQVKVNGYRIELGDLEANLRALPEIADAVVLPVEKSGRIDSLAAFVVLAGERDADRISRSPRASRRSSASGCRPTWCRANSSSSTPSR